MVYAIIDSQGRTLAEVFAEGKNEALRKWAEYEGYESYEDLLYANPQMKGTHAVEFPGGGRSLGWNDVVGQQLRQAADTLEHFETWQEILEVAVAEGIKEGLAQAHDDWPEAHPTLSKEQYAEIRDKVEQEFRRIQGADLDTLNEELKTQGDTPHGIQGTVKDYVSDICLGEARNLAYNMVVDAL